MLLPFVLVGGVALDNGGFEATTWGWSTLLPLVVAGAAFVTGWARRPGRLALGYLGLLVAFSVWTWLSVAWSVDLSQSVLEGERQLVYVASAAAFLVLERRDVPRFLAGLLAAIAVVCIWALCLRAFGGTGSYDVASVSPDATRRLAEPIGYSNGLGAFAAIGTVVAGTVALRARRPLVAGLLLLYVPTLYFTYSRGAWLALAGGALAALALAPPRVPRLLALAAGLAVVAAVAVALVRAGGPGGVVDKFSGAGPTVKAGKQSRLLSLSGSSRAQYWHVAWREYEAHPWLGTGAGGFQRGWLRLRPAPLPVLDAHSLYLETLSELGPVGLALLVALLAVPLGAALTVRRHPLTAAACGGYVVFLVHAAQDWDWELPAVTLAGLACAAALLLLAERQPRAALSRSDRAVGVSAAAALALVALAALAGNEAVSAAGRALDGDRPKDAAADARWAQRLVPWSPDGWRLHGEAQLSQGDVEAAQHSFERAVEKDGRDWESWADLALVTRGNAHANALAHARRLNPFGQTASTRG